ncbi:MAG: thioredoxin-like domain-containing protein [Chitinophagales bacterium]
MAPEVELPDLNGKNLKLSQLRGNVVLVSFWSTWCAACNAIKNPEYRQLYNRYKDYTFENADGFTIYSVAFDSDKSKWQRRIEEAQLDWPTHVIDQDSYYSYYWFIYNIKSIPSSFLLDETGKVIGANMTYSQLDTELGKRRRGRKVKNVLVVGETSGTQGNTNNSTTTKPTPTPTPFPTQTVQKEVYKIQIGVFRNPNLAKFSALNDLGTLETESVSKLQRVLLGSFSEAQSQSVLRTVKARGYRDAFLVKRKGTGTSQPENVIVDVIDEPKQPQSGESTTTTPVSGNEGDFNSTYLEKVYKIQLGVFSKFIESKFKNVKPYGKIDVESTNSGLSKVLLGSFKTSVEANDALKQVRPKGFKDAFLVKREEMMTITAASNVTRYVPTWQRNMSETGEEDTTSYLALMKLEYPALQGTMVGEVAPEILLRNRDGAALPLSALQEKYTLVHFWGSWSGPSRQNHEDLKKIYNDFHGKNFEIYSVAFDEKSDKWKEVIKEDAIGDWKVHVIDPEGTKSDLLKMYKVKYLPAMFLVDEEGTVIGENLSYEQLRQVLQQKLK